MSIMYCERHNNRYDSDYVEGCPRCNNGGSGEAMNYDEEAAKAVTIREDEDAFWIEYGGEEYILTEVSDFEDAEIIARHLRKFVVSFAKRATEDMRERCVKVADNLSDTWHKEYKEGNSEHRANPHREGMSDGAELVGQAIARLEVK